MRIVLLTTLIALCSIGCGPKLADCEAIATEQADCMNDVAKADCEATNTQCADELGGEVLVLESCPLQFACSTP
jgi:hypothetical protein